MEKHCGAFLRDSCYIEGAWHDVAALPRIQERVPARRSTGARGRRYLSQLDDSTRAAVLGNVGTLIAFRVGPDDAQLLHRQFGGGVAPLDFEHLPNHDMYVQMVVEGAPARCFSARAMRSGN